MANRVMLTMASRIHGDIYVRFRGRYGETYRRKAARHPMPSLQTNFAEVQPERLQKLKEKFKQPELRDTAGMYVHNAMDEMVRRRVDSAPYRPTSEWTELSILPRRTKLWCR